MRPPLALNGLRASEGGPVDALSPALLFVSVIVL